MKLNKIKLNTVFLCDLCGKVFNIRAYLCLSRRSAAKTGAFVVQTPNTRQFPGKSNAQNLISRNEPNLNKEDYTLTHEITRNYNRSPRNHHPRNEPILIPFRTHLNPIRTQYEPNLNPKQTQFKARVFGLDCC